MTAMFPSRAGILFVNGDDSPQSEEAALPPRHFINLTHWQQAAAYAVARANANVDDLADDTATG